MKHYTTFVGSCSFTIMFLFAGLSTAATKYVSNTGNNNQSGNSWSQAWLTLQYAVDHIFAGDDFSRRADDQVQINARHDIGVAGFPDFDNPPVPDANIAFDDPPSNPVSMRW